MIQKILCVFFLTNTITSLHWFLDAEVEKGTSNSAEEVYEKNINLIIALSERIFPFKIYKNLKFVNDNLQMKT